MAAIAYDKLRERIRSIVGEVVRPGARVLVVSRGDEELVRFDRSVGRHFPQGEDGSYLGYHPASGARAIEHLEELRAQGGGYFVLPAPCFWWRDEYPELFAHLADHATIVWHSDACLIYRHDSEAGSVDTLAEVGDGAFYLQGWIHDFVDPVRRVTAVSPEGERIELLEKLFRYRRPDRGRLDGASPELCARGWSEFIVYFEAAPSNERAGWVVEVEDDLGDVMRMTAPLVVRDVALVRGLIVEGLPTGALPDERLMSNHVFPAMDRVQERSRGLVKIDRVTDYGVLEQSPDISIVIPLYSRLDLVEHQLSEFVRDPELRATELVYVLDSPNTKDWLLERASDLSRMYPIPFRVAVMKRHSGFAAAINAGASIAAGRLLLLLNSDVIPDEPGWLGTMQRFYDSRDRIGALGAKLLYEDGSLQHAGMYFEVVDEGPFVGLWANMHYFKGLSRHLPDANVARPVPAVTAACLMIEKELYDSVGGLTEVYAQGDFEDSDLCLRLLEMGRESWYLPDAELYHLEGQSYEDASREKLALYNRWLQTRRRGRLIEASVARYPRRPAAHSVAGG